MNYTFTKTIDIKMQIKFCGYLLQFYLHIMQFQTYKINCLCFLKKSKINKKEILRFFCNREGKKMSGIRGSNPRPSAWKADALPTELIPLKFVGGGGFEPPKACASRFTVCPSWPLWYPPLILENQPFLK